MIFPLVGNEKIKLSVENFVKEERIPHAILIEGDYGSGRHTLAKFLSGAIIGNETDFHSHPDITVIAPEDKKKSISVSQIRNLREESVVKPHQANKRVFIIDPADTMNDSAQNALLKDLEEPPKTVMFILIATNKSVLLETIISRCVVLSLTPPQKSVALDYIKSVSKKSEEEITKALGSSQNNIGKALELLKGKKGSNTEIAANAFLAAMLKGDSFTMLSEIKRFEKDRVLSDKFIKDLKYAVVNKIKSDVGSVYAKPLTNFYNCLPEYEQSLATNINLNLLFCSMTCKATELFGG